MDNSDSKRDAIHAVIQEHGPDLVEGAAVLTGWALVADWMDENGERWLTKCHSASIPKWTAEGMHHEALYGDWPEAEEGGL